MIVKYAGNHRQIINNILYEKQVLVINTFRGEIIAQYLKQKYSFPLHLSDERFYLSLSGIAMSKSLPERICKQINHL